MKKIFAITTLLVLFAFGIAQAQLGVPGLIKVREADGDPTGWVYEIVVTNDGLSLSGNTGTISLTAGAGQPVTLTIGGEAKSADLAGVIITNDTNSIFTEAPADNLAIDVSKRWPTADVANAGDSATAFFSAGTIEAARLPSVSTTSGGIIPDTGSIAAGWVPTVQSDGTIAYAASASGVTTFAALTDTPANYTDAGGKLLRVNSGADAVEFFDAWGGNQTITGNWVNTANPWADNEVADALTISGGTVNNSVIGGSTPAAITGTTITATGVLTATAAGANITAADGQYIDLSGITHTANTAEGLVLPTWADVAYASNVKNGTIAWSEGSTAIKIKSAAGWQSVGATAAPIDAKYLTTTSDGTLSDEFNLGTLTTGLLRITVDGGVATPSTATSGTDYAPATSGTAILKGSGAGGFSNATFADVAAGTNANALVIGTGGSLGVSGTGTINATSLGAKTWAAPDAIGSSTPAAGTFTNLTATGTTTIATATTGMLRADSGVVSAATAGTHYPGLASANTFTGNNVFGDGDTDTLTVRSLIAGYGTRGVQITDSVATPTNISDAYSLYVKSNIEVGGNVYAAEIISAPADDAHILLDQATAGDTDWYWGVNGDSEGDDDDSMVVGTGSTVGSNIKLTIDTSGNTIATGYAKSTYIVLEGGTYDTTIQPGTPAASVSYTWPSNAPAVTGYTLTSTTAGVMSWAPATASAGGSATHVQYNTAGNLDGEAAFAYNATNNTLSLTQAASNPTLQVGDGTYSWNHTPQVGIEGVLEVDSNFFANGGIVFGSDGAITTAGEVGYASGAFTFFGANSENAVLTVGSASNVNTFSSGTSATYAFTPSVALNGGATVGGTLALGANNLTMTGSLGATGAGKLTKVWAADAEFTNAPSVNGVAGNATNGLVTNPMTGAGDMIIGGASGATTRLAAGATTEVLVGGGAAAPVWTTATGTGAPVRAGSPTFTTKITTPLIDLGAGISATGGAGVVTFTDLGGTSEVLAIDLRTENTAKLTTTSGVSDLNIGALNLVTTGQISGRIPVVADADGKTLAGTDLYGSMQMATGAGTWVIPDVDAAAGTGQAFCVYTTGAYEIVIDGNAEDKIRLAGTLGAAGGNITNATAEAAGDFICLMLTDFAGDVAHWTTLGSKGTWTVP